MARLHSRFTVITVGGVNLSAFITNSELSRTADSHDTTGYGIGAKTYISGLEDATLSLEGIYDDGADDTPRTELMPLLGGDAVAIVRQPEGAGTGKGQETFNAILTDYTESNPVGDLVTFSAEFQVTGAITDTDQS